MSDKQLGYDPSIGIVDGEKTITIRRGDQLEVLILDEFIEHNGTAQRRTGPVKAVIMSVCLTDLLPT